MLRPVVASVLLMAGAALADEPELPARYDVTGADALPLWPGPGGEGTALDTLAAGSTGIEVVGFSEDGAWAEIGRGEGNAWVAAKGLTRQTGRRAESLPMRCYGTEPFWGLNMPSPFYAEFEQPEHPEMPLQITGASEAVGPLGRVRLWSFAGETATASVTVRSETCHDGMSDRRFGLSATFTLIEKTGETRLALGCCMLSAP